MNIRSPKDWNGNALEGLWLVTRKLDGVRAIRGEMGAITRGGQLWAGIVSLPADDCEVFLGSWGATISAMQAGDDIPADAIYPLGDSVDPRLVITEVLDPEPADIRELADAAIASGDEGVVLYSLEGKGWVRVKKHSTVDLEVTGVQVKGLVVTALETTQGKVPVTGSRIRAEVSDMHWIDGAVAGAIIEVKYQEMTAAGKMRSPKLVRFRPDRAA